MDTRFSEEELAFQAEVREFFANVMDEELLALLEGAEASPTLKEGMVEYQRRLNARGWMAPGWPVEYGGRGATSVEQLMFFEEAQHGLNLVLDPKEWPPASDESPCWADIEDFQQ